MTVFPGIPLLHRVAICLALFYLTLAWWRVWGSPFSTKTTPAKAKRPPQPLKPRTPDDCLACVRSAAMPSMSAPSTSVRPWREVKSTRGRPKQINTAGYACDYKDCKYRGITDSRIHALVGYGHHGKDQSIQDFCCEACGHKFSARRHTALYRL